MSVPLRPLPSSVPPIISLRFQKMPNGSLLIIDVTTDDTGRYTCVAGNSCSIKDRVAQLYVVGEWNTRTRHTNMYIQTGFLYREQRCTHGYTLQSQVKNEGVY